MLKKHKTGIVWAIIVVTLMIAAWYVSKYHYQLMLIQGDSMTPTYHNLQLVVLDKHDREYAVGDVIAFRCDGLDCVLVKRIAEITSDNRYYVLGDNQSKSVDSRDERVGYVEREDIVGYVL